MLGKADNGSMKPRALGVDGAELFDITCWSCKKHHKLLQDGQFHCKHCGVMCENCAADHEKNPKVKGHWAEKLRIVRNDVVFVPTFNYVTKCELHPKRKISGYCLDHGDLCCNECLMSQHSMCAIEPIENMCEGIEKGIHMLDAQCEFSELRRRCKRVSSTKQDEIRNVSKQASAFEDKVKKVKEQAIKVLDDMVTAILKDKEKFCKSELEVIEKDMKECSDLSKVLDTASKNLEEAYRNGKPNELWVAMKKLEQLITYNDEIIAKMEDNRSDVRLEFLPSKSLKGLLESSENVGKMRVTSSRLYGRETDGLVTPKLSKMEHDKSSGKTATTKNSDFYNPHPWIKSTKIAANGHSLPQLSGRSRSTDRANSTAGSENTLTNKTKNGHMKTASQRKGLQYPLVEELTDKVHAGITGQTEDIKLTQIGQKEIMTPEDTVPNSITGSTFLPNGRLVLIDNHNKTLKLFSAEYEFLAGVCLDERPWNVTSCYKRVVAVSYPYAMTLDIVNTGLDMKFEGKIKTDRACHGMAFHKTEKWLYIACGEGTHAQIQAFSLDGLLRKVIIPKEGVLSEPCYMAMSADSSRLFISDLDNGVVGFTTKTGDVVCQYKDKKIKRYWDLKLDDRGRIFVLTTGPDCLYALSVDRGGKLVKEFQTGSKPCSLSYSPVSKDLVVTSWTSEDITVYRFL